MSDLNIVRNHNLGLDKARNVTDEWIQSAKNDYGMRCELTRTDDKDVVAFKRTGVKGELVTTATAFEMKAKLGFLFKSFLPKIEQQINKNLDDMLG